LADVSDPIFTGEPKLPLASDNCAVKTFPALKVPDIVYGTETPDPGQNGEPEIVPVAMVGPVPITDPDNETFLDIAPVDESTAFSEL
jgi:hypothetical protein